MLATLDEGRDFWGFLRGFWRVFGVLEKVIGFYKDRKKLTYFLLSHLKIEIICSEFPPLIQEENDLEAYQIIIVIVKFWMMKMESVSNFLL